MASNATLKWVNQETERIDRAIESEREDLKRYFLQAAEAFSEYAERMEFEYSFMNDPGYKFDENLAENATIWVTNCIKGINKLNSQREVLKDISMLMETEARK